MPNINYINHISNSTFAIGDKNEINASGNHYEMDWEKAADSCLEALRLLPADSREYRALKEVLPSVYEKNSSRLMNIIKQHARALTSKLFVSTASAFLVNLIQNALGF